MMKIYNSPINPIPGTSKSELTKIAWDAYNEIASNTRRQPYIRTSKKSYFKGRKVFLKSYLPHINQKHPQDAVRRYKMVFVAFDFVKNNPYPPTIKPNPNRKKYVLLRFIGKTKNGKYFCVQIQQNAKGECYLMSAFPYDMRE